MQPQTTLKLAEETGNIIAVKEASGDMEQVDELMAGRPDEFPCIVGRRCVGRTLIEKGATGLSPSWPMPIQPIWRRWCRAAMARDARSHRLWSDIAELEKSLFAEGNPTV